MTLDAVGALLVVAGVALFILEVIHPGAFLLIPGTVLLVGGVMWILSPAFLTATVVGPVIVALAALVSVAVSFPIYQRMAPNHPPMVTNPTTLIGRTGLVTVSVIPDSLAGKVQIDSEIWSARADRAIPAGGRVRVVAGEGVCVIVEPIQATGPN